MTEKRKFIRHDAIHLLDYLVLDQGREDSGVYSMGRTLDVSRSGLKLETAQPFQQGEKIKVTLGLADQLVDLCGTVIYCRNRHGRFISGITFDGVPNSSRRILELYVTAFTKRNSSH